MNFNYITNAVYSDKNQELLDLHAAQYELNSNAWAGFKQWADNNRKVKKGSKAAKIQMVCAKKYNKDGEEKTFTVCKTVAVFNYDQTEEIKAP